MEGIRVDLTLQLNLERWKGVSLMVEVKKGMRAEGTAYAKALPGK